MKLVTEGAKPNLEEKSSFQLKLEDFYQEVD